MLLRLRWKSIIKSYKTIITRSREIWNEHILDDTRVWAESDRSQTDSYGHSRKIYGHFIEIVH